jgi:hypothetical protein
VGLFGRPLIPVPLVQEKHHEQKHEHGGNVEWRKESLGTRLFESSLDTNLARYINDRRRGCGSKVHLLTKKDVFSTAKQRAG